MNISKKHISSLIEKYPCLSKIEEDIVNATNTIILAFKSNKKLLLVGNGGSAADAQHIAAELVGRYKNERQGLAAIAITTDTSILTCLSNDYGYEKVFSRQIEALSKKGDVAIGISTGGKSVNVINALKLARKMGCKTIGLSGRNGGEFNSICDTNIIIPDDDTPRIQEMHILIGHMLCELIDNEFKLKK